MYNEELKMRFIDKRDKEIIVADNYIKNIFIKSQDMENMLNKDLSNFSLSEIIEMYKMFNISSFESLLNTNSIYKVYTDWCNGMNLIKDSQNHFAELNRDIIYSCLNKMKILESIVSRKQLLEMIRELVNPRDQFTLLALFEGIKGDDSCEIAYLKPEDIDRNNKTAKLCTGRIVEISDELINIIDECINECTYYSMAKGLRNYPLQDNGYIYKDFPNIKSTDNQYRKGRNIYNSISRALKLLDVFGKITANNISDSGILYRMIKKADEHNISFNEYILSKFYHDEIENYYKKTIIRNKFIKYYNDYLQ